MYDALADPYCYPDTSVLKNIPGLRLQRDLDRFEAVATAQRFLEPMPTCRWSVRHDAAVHRHIFQYIYTWSGRFRTVRVSKGGSMFCYLEHIHHELRRVFADLRAAAYFRDLSAADFAKGMAHFAAELNALHAFREGNGRAQLAFLVLLAAQARHPLDLETLKPVAFLDAMVKSFHGIEGPLAVEFGRLIRKS